MVYTTEKIVIPLWRWIAVIHLGIMNIHMSMDGKVSYSWRKFY